MKNENILQFGNNSTQKELVLTMKWTKPSKLPIPNKNLVFLIKMVRSSGTSNKFQSFGHYCKKENAFAFFDQNLKKLFFKRIPLKKEESSLLFISKVLSGKSFNLNSSNYQFILKTKNKGTLYLQGWCYLPETN